jgi:hypothetical protein
MPPAKPHSRWTADTKTAFLLALRQHGQVTLATAAIGRHRNSAYSVRRGDAEFAARWDAVLAEVQAGWIAEAAALPAAERVGRERRDGWTADTRARFLALLARGESVRAACAAVGLDEAGAYRLRRRSHAFAADWERAVAERSLTPIEAAYARAVEGWEEPVVFQGQVVATKRRYSDAALRLLVQREDRRAEQAAAAAERASAREGTRYAKAEDTDRTLLARLSAIEKRRKAEARERAVAEADRLLAAGLIP